MPQNVAQIVRDARHPVSFVEGIHLIKDPNDVDDGDHDQGDTEVVCNTPQDGGDGQPEPECQQRVYPIGIMVGVAQTERHSSRTTRCSSKNGRVISVQNSINSKEEPTASNSEGEELYYLLKIIRMVDSASKDLVLLLVHGRWLRREGV